VIDLRKGNMSLGTLDGENIGFLEEKGEEEEMTY